MPTFLLEHRHEAADCEAAFAAWRGYQSELRGRTTASTCLRGDHRLWWFVEADDERCALAMLPPFVATRAVAVPVRQIEVP